MNTPDTGLRARLRRALAPDVAGSDRQRWSLELHDVGRGGWILAGAVFVVVGVTHSFGLGTPRDAMSDEYLYARSAAEYLNRQEPAEWTHPPLSKELMAVGMRWFSRPVVSSAPAPAGLGALAAVRGRELTWAFPTASGAALEGANLEEKCGVGRESRRSIRGIRPTALSIGPRETVLGGVGEREGVLVGVGRRGIVWRARVTGVPVRIAALRDAVFWVAKDGRLFRSTRGGEGRLIDRGAADVVAVDEDHSVWVSFPGKRRVAILDATGHVRSAFSVRVHPDRLAVPVSFERGRAFHSLAAVATDVDGAQVVSVDPRPEKDITGRLQSYSNQRAVFVAPSVSGYVWATRGTRVSVLEAISLAPVHTVGAGSEIRALLGDARGRGVVAVAGNRIVCMRWDPMFGLRLPSVLAAAAVVALVSLIALTLSGSLVVASFATLFAAIDGFSLTLARLASPDYGVVALVLAAWFCLLSALRSARTTHSSRTRDTRVWLAGCGLAVGLAAAYKWAGAWALPGIFLVVAWDVRARRTRPGVVSAFGSSPFAVIAPFATIGAAAAAAYAAAFVPHAFLTGVSPSDILELHGRMYRWHAYEARGFHYLQSYWYQWPLGAKPIPLHIEAGAKTRVELTIMVNPVVAYAGALAFIGVVVRAVRTRSMALLILVIAAAFQYLPWIYVSRLAFLYQYAAVTPFLAVALAWWPMQHGITRRRVIVVAVVAAAAAVAFVALLPALAGWRMPTAYFETIRMWLPWMFKPPEFSLFG